MKITARGLVL